jgi:hypothetical protein
MFPTPVSARPQLFNPLVKIRQTATAEQADLNFKSSNFKKPPKDTFSQPITLEISHRFEYVLIHR